MSVWDKVVGIVNKAMNTEAQQILDELKAECPRSAEGHNGKHVADSFKIMGMGSEAMVSTGRVGGLITDVKIGSTELGAYYAAYGNGGSGRIIRSTRGTDRKGRVPGKMELKDGTYRTMVHGYTPSSNFVKDVADRHR